eukprot:4531589-Prymnesium_polylepis.1
MVTHRRSPRRRSHLSVRCVSQRAAHGKPRGRVSHDNATAAAAHGLAGAAVGGRGLVIRFVVIVRVFAALVALAAALVAAL